MPQDASFLVFTHSNNSVSHTFSFSSSLHTFATKRAVARGRGRPRTLFKSYTIQNVNRAAHSKEFFKRKTIGPVAKSLFDANGITRRWTRKVLFTNRKRSQRRTHNIRLAHLLFPKKYSPSPEKVNAYYASLRPVARNAARSSPSSSSRWIGFASSLAPGRVYTSTP